MEYAPRAIIHLRDRKQACLNPCFSGICAASKRNYFRSSWEITVLILVLVEYAPRVKEGLSVGIHSGVLILVLVEYAPREEKKQGVKVTSWES